MRVLSTDSTRHLYILLHFDKLMIITGMLDLFL